MSNIESALSPLVYWAQNDKEIFLKIDLCDVDKPKIVLTENVLEFEAEGLGARGKNVYRFNLRFYERINPKRSSWKVHDSRIEIQLRKFVVSGPEFVGNFWPRLISQPQKPHWLKIDFNRWISNEPVEEENYDEKKYHDKTKSNRSVLQDYPDAIKNLQKQEYGYIKEKSKKVYLIFYNLFQYLGFLYLAIVMGILYFRDGSQEIRQIYKSFNSVIKFLHLLQYIEILHSLLRLTFDSPIYPFLQITLRNFIIFGIVEPDPTMQEKPIIFILYFIWFVNELIRYPYNIIHLLKLDFKLQIYIRNKVWKVLYLVEVILECFIILQNHPYLNKIVVDFPNQLGWAFDMALSLKLYVFFLIVIGTYFTILHMVKRRSRRLDATKRKTEKLK